MNDRINRLQEAMKAHKNDCLALNPGPSLTYLTGLHFHLMERPVVAFFTAQGRPGIVLPALEMAKLAEIPMQLEAFPYGDDPLTWASAFNKAFEALKLHGSTMAIEPIRFRVLELRYLEAAGKNIKISDGSKVIESLRMIKDADEIAKMRQAAVIAQQGLLETLKSIKIGMSEKEIASELVIQLFKAGSDVDLPFQPIVSSGPNSANPHAVPSDRKLQEGDLLLFDWGATKEGYFSDITRTFTVGQVDPELIKIGEIVMKANEAGRKSCRAGMSAGEVDIVSRSVIENAGYGEYFIHRTGHGLGLEAHEAPYLFTENDQVLEEGMTFTIEPGIYLPGRGGVRIEDDVVVTQSGFECLTDLPRQVLSLESFQEG
ncbi:MAG: Xaa-Pro peptidase family protein [Anaerolineaceae bacterium]|nr:Xaa-Pro peptidase family protein [Anaerolineaceae bacterium]